MSAQKPPGLGDKHRPAARTPGSLVPGLPSDLQQVASFPFSSISLLLLWWEMLRPNPPALAAAGRRFICTGQINHRTSFSAGRQSQAVQGHLPRGFHSLVGAYLPSFCCLRALAASALPLCSSPSPGISSLLSFFPSCRKSGAPSNAGHKTISAYSDAVLKSPLVSFSEVWRPHQLLCWSSSYSFELFQHPARCQIISMWVKAQRMLIKRPSLCQLRANVITLASSPIMWHRLKPN